jgi:hypothetical protein
MRSAIALRTDFTGSELRHPARYTRDANQARRGAFADELETKADAAERASIMPYLMLA